MSSDSDHKSVSALLAELGRLSEGSFWSCESEKDELSTDERVQEMLGLPPTQPITFDLLDKMCTPESKVVLLLARNALFQSNSPADEVLQFETPKGRVVIRFRARRISLQPNEQRIVGSFVRHADIEGAAEESVESILDRYSSLLRCDRLVIFEWRSDDDESFCSSQLAKLLGFRSSEIDLSWENIQKRIHPADLRDLNQKIQKQKKMGQVQIEFRMYRKDRSTLWIETTARIDLDSKDRIRKITAVCTDVTQRKFTQSKMDQIHREMDRVIQLANLGLYEWNIKEDRCQLSDVYCRQLGYEPGELVMSSEFWVRCIHPDDLESCKENLEKFISNKTSLIDHQYRMKHKDGSWVWIWDKSGVVERDRERKPLVIAGIHIDITKEKELEEALDQERLIALNTSKLAALGEMAAGIAHEINNPLAVITGASSQANRALQEDQPDLEKVSRNLKRVEDTAHRIAKIVQGLRTFSRDASNDDFDEVDVKSIVEDSVSLCGQKLANAGVDIRLSPEVNSGLIVRARAAQISQVLVNLINNGFHAIENRKEKWIEIDAKKIGDFVEIWVTDSGTGIPEEVAKKIMQPFFTTKAVGKGTGLGLSISRGILERHQGELTLDMECKNTRFVLRIPYPKKSESSGGKAA